MIGAQVEIASALSLPSGYHRDLQVTKGPLLRAMRQGLGALSLVARLVKDMELQPERMRAAITREMFATDRATEMARTGVPFRDAYLAVAKDLGGGAGPSIEASLAGRVSAGATAALRLAEMRARLDAEKAKLGAALPSHEENSQGAESRSSGRRRD